MNETWSTLEDERSAKQDPVLQIETSAKYTNNTTISFLCVHHGCVTIQKCERQQRNKEIIEANGDLQVHEGQRIVPANEDE